MYCVSRTLTTWQDIPTDLSVDELQKAKEVSQIDRPEISQALCTVLQIALVDLLKSFKVLPSVVVGHSSGEIAAA
jgi:acyl transferase domain-containing protein